MAEIDAKLYLEFCAAREVEKNAKAVKDGLAAQIREAAGDDEVVTVDGVKVGTYERINKFPVQKFIKENADLAQQFMVIRAEKVFDERLFRRAAPDIYARYQTRQLSIEG